MNNINFKGYYLSEPISYKDSHAGIEIQHTNYVAYYFIDENIVYKSAKKNISSFSKSDFLIDGMEVEYAIQDNTIEFYYDKISRFTKRRYFKALSVDTILDEKLIKYNWTSWNSEIEDSPTPKTDL